MNGLHKGIGGVVHGRSAHVHVDAAFYADGHVLRIYDFDADLSSAGLEPREQVVTAEPAQNSDLDVVDIEMCVMAARAWLDLVLEPMADPGVQERARGGSVNSYRLAS
jgi:hypothetical protein